MTDTKVSPSPEPPAAPTEPDPPCAKCGQPVTDERFAVQSYETGAWTHDTCPPVCTPSTYPNGAMERMSRRGDIEAGATIATPAAPLGAGPDGEPRDFEWQTRLLLVRVCEIEERISASRIGRAALSAAKACGVVAGAFKRRRG